MTSQLDRLSRVVAAYRSTPISVEAGNLAAYRSYHRQRRTQYATSMRLHIRGALAQRHGEQVARDPAQYVMQSAAGVHGGKFARIAHEDGLIEQWEPELRHARVFLMEDATRILRRREAHNPHAEPVRLLPIREEIVGGDMEIHLL